MPLPPPAPPPALGNTASASTSSLTGAFYAAPQCAAFPTFSRPRAAPTHSPLPPPLHPCHPRRETLPIRTIAGLRVTRVITCVDLGRYGRRESKEERRERRERRRREKARERKYGGRKRRGCRNRNRNRPTFTFTLLCRLFHSFHSRISLSRPRPWPRDSRRDRSTIAPAASFLLSPPPASLLASAPVPASGLGRPRKNKPTRTGREETRAFPIFELARPFLCKHFQGGSREEETILARF